MRLEYRADIDYLRVLAVVAVIGFHYDLPGFGGGFVGVDIFFVISGYVIARLIWSEIDAGSFSFLRFYERRARRLLPALYLMILSTGVAAWFVAPPDDYRMFFGSAVSALLFSSNIFFWLQTGYFDLPTVGKVLIHTWSLSVEEQFYFLFPVVTWLWSRLFADPTSRRSLGLVAAGTVALCVLSELWIKQSASAAFYVAPLRAWEFLVGSIVFLGQRWSPVRLPARLLLATLGFAFTLLPVVAFRPETRFPGFNALLPCLGAALYILAFNQEQGRPALPFGTFGARLGRLSYSLYLWHWPVFVLGRAALPLEAAGSVSATAALLLLTVLLASLSFVLVERPARERIEWRGVPGARLIACAAVVLIAIGAHGYSNDGYAQRFPQSQARMLRYNSQTVAPFYRTHSCFLQPDEPLSTFDMKDCLKPIANKRNVLLAGDSIAAHYDWGLRSYFPSDSVHLMQMTAAACAPFVELKQDTSRSCNEINQMLRAQIKARRFTGIILSGNWRFYSEFYDRPTEQRFHDYLRSLLAAADEAGIPVLLLGPSLEFPAPLAATLFNYERSHLPAGKSFMPIEGAFKADDRMREIARSYPSVQYVSILDAICRARECPLKADPETPITWDIIHLTPEGSRFVVAQLKPQLDAFLSRLQTAPAGDMEELMAGSGVPAPQIHVPSQLQ
ncbi:acyltransferase family protein [Bradyrhizobium sp. USDA 4369]